jgi:hypothetical protein
MRIFIRTLTGFKDFGINVEPYYSIGMIKKQIELFSGYLAVQQILIFDKFILADEEQLTEFDIQDNYTLTLVLKEQQYTQFVTIRTPTGSQIRLGVKPTFTGEDLKWLIQLELGTPPEMQRLIYEGKILGINDTIGSFDIPSDKPIYLIIQQRGS